MAGDESYTYFGKRPMPLMYCPKCKKEAYHSVRKADSGKLFALTFATAGLFLPIALGISINESINGQFVCLVCKHRHKGIIKN